MVAAALLCPLGWHSVPVLCVLLGEELSSVLYKAGENSEL